MSKMMLIVVGFFFVLFPMGKVKLCEDAIGWLKQIVSIPYGKGWGAVQERSDWVTAPMQQRSEKASRRRRLIGKAPLRKRISPKRAYESRTSIPYGKGKDRKDTGRRALLWVSIPYGKGKGEHADGRSSSRHVSIPYGKGKANHKNAQKFADARLNSLWER